MAMAVRSSQKRKLLLFVGLGFLHLHGAEDTLATHTGSICSIAEKSAHSNGNSNGTSGWIHRHRDVRSVYAVLLEECGDRKALAKGKIIHAHIIDLGFIPELFLGTKLVIMYAKCGSLLDARRALEEIPNPNMVSWTALMGGYAQDGQIEDALKLFQKMPTRDVVSWTAMIAAYARHGYNEQSLSLYHGMQREGIPPNKFTFSGVLPACANLGSPKHGKEVHGDAARCGLRFDIFVGSALVDMYVKCGCVEYACQVFDEMSQRNVVTWNALIAGCAQNGQVDLAMKHFQKMPERDMISWTAMIVGYVQNGQADEALSLFQKMQERDVVSWAAIIAGYSQNGQVDAALRLFQNIPELEVVSWNAMIAGFAQNGRFGEALELFRDMQFTCVKSDSVTFTSILPACANTAALISGKVVHTNIIRTGFQCHISVGNALVDMYGKCGTIEDACQVFDEMAERDVVSWNTMIVGYANHGCAEKALQLFEQMQLSGTKSNHVTFIGVLSACSHAGLVDEGWQYFNLMSWGYCITPMLEHYCCMVDLLGRAGCLIEAEDFIRKMPVEPDVAVWSSLLGACRIHARVEVGKRVAESLFELDSRNAASYVLLSNIYAAAGRWEDAQKVRKLMKDRRAKKIPGCSWIEVNNRVSTFFVGDKSHPQTHKIYAELERLSQQMKAAGYVPDMSLMLHDAE